MDPTPAREEWLRSFRLDTSPEVVWNPPAPRLYERTVLAGSGRIAFGGPLVVDTTPYTGRSARDKYIVREPGVDPHVAWGTVNVPLPPDRFELLLEDVLTHLGRRPLFVEDLAAGADPAYRVPVRVVSESPWHALFARNLLLRVHDERAGRERPITILHAPSLGADPERHGTRSEVVIVLELTRRLVLITGTPYAGEIKKSVFSALNYLLPRQGVLTMHCSANVGRAGDVALFFGLSGTGKTTLSADPERLLIGDDEHAWSDRGVFNIEGGCYAKVIRLHPGHEPEIFETTRRFGTILENVILDEETRRIDLDDDRKTENTRAAYPITHLPNIVPDGVGGHPRAIVFLTADAFGVLPPISRLTAEQAKYYFLSGYTAKLAGTERGVKEPQATFSACFGEPFLPLPPSIYANMLRDRIRHHAPSVWLVNTGWTGGPFGVGHRIPIPFTRAMVRAALDGRIGDDLHPDPAFGLMVPRSVPEVPDGLLDARASWSDPAAYDGQAAKLAEMFRTNFRRYEGMVSFDIGSAAPSPHRS